MIHRCPRLRRHRLLVARSLLSILLVAVGASSNSIAAVPDRCQPRVLLPADQPLEVAIDEPSPPVWLEARLDKALELPLSAVGLAITSDGSQSRSISVRGQVVGGGVVRDDQATLVVDADAGLLRLGVGADRRYVARIVERSARGADGATLTVSPNLHGLSDFEVRDGASVRRVGTDQVVIERGATLVWRAQPGQPLKFYLTRAHALLQTAAAGQGHQSHVTPERVPLGGKLAVRLTAAEVDLRNPPPTFCLSSGDRTVALPGNFNRQDGEKAYFDLRLGIDEVKDLVQDSSIWQRIHGVRATLRAVAYRGSVPVMDAPVELRLTSVRWSALMGIAGLVLLYAVCAVLMRRLNPFAIVGRFIVNPSERYSLSSLQVLLWTLLVLFAMVFTWVGTDQLLPLSMGVLGLLGIAGTSSVLARAAERVTPEERAPKPRPSGPKLADLVSDADDRFDLLRFQMLAFTLFSLAYSAYSVVRSDGLPELPDSLYLLMGISNGTYVLGKMPGLLNQAAPLAPSVPLAGEEALSPERVRQLQQRLQLPVTGVIDAATRAGVEAYKRSNELYPVDGRIHAALLQRLAV